MWSYGTKTQTFKGCNSQSYFLMHKRDTKWRFKNIIIIMLWHNLGLFYVKKLEHSRAEGGEEEGSSLFCQLYMDDNPSLLMGMLCWYIKSIVINKRIKRKSRPFIIIRTRITYSKNKFSKSCCFKTWEERKFKNLKKRPN